MDVTASRWYGLFDGWGQLAERHTTGAVSGRHAGGRTRSADLVITDAHGQVSLPAATQCGSGESSVADVAVI